MRRKLVIHLTFGFGFFVLVTLARGWLSFATVPFWIGGFIGVLLPDIDHLIYVYMLRPHELTSQRATRMVSGGRIREAGHLLASTGPERNKLIFHTAPFQILFMVFTFLVVSSTGSFLGRGLVLGFALHLLVDQLDDLLVRGSLDSWFYQVKIQMDRERSVLYWVVMALALLVMAFLF